MTKYRKKDENVDDYIERLYRNQPSLGLSNKDIGDLINHETGYGYDESSYRKKYKERIIGFDKGYNKGLADGSNDDAELIINKIQAKEDKLYKQQVKTRDALREYRGTLRDEARVENLLDRFITCANIMSKSDPIVIPKEYKPNTDKIAVIQLSDWHFAEIVDNFMNTYNEGVFDDRIKVLTNEVVVMCKNMGVRHLKVLNHNDLISGNIHVSVRVASSEDAIYQIEYVAETIAKMLEVWANEFDAVEFYNVNDNHSRLNKNKKEHIEKENLVRFIPVYLKARLTRVGNVKVLRNIINNSNDFDIGRVPIFDSVIYFTHGHLDGIKNIISNLSFMTKEFPVAVFMGHIHKNYEDEFHGIDLIVSPSFIGVGNYSKDARMTSRARQKLTIFENVDGIATRYATFFINLN